MNNSTPTTSSGSRGVWSDDEHERFLEGLHMYPNGPWKAVAEFVGTRTVRQVQTHAQKYHEKAARRLRDLRQNRARGTAPEPSIDQEMKQICESLQRNRVPLSPLSAQRQQQSIDLFTEAAWLYFGDGSTDATTTPHAACSDEIPSFDECLDFLIDALGAHTGSASDSDSP